MSFKLKCGPDTDVFSKFIKDVNSSGNRHFAIKKSVEGQGKEEEKEEDVEVEEKRTGRRTRR